MNYFRVLSLYLIKIFDIFPRGKNKWEKCKCISCWYKLAVSGHKVYVYFQEIQINIGVDNLLVFTHFSEGKFHIYNILYLGTREISQVVEHIPSMWIFLCGFLEVYNFLIPVYKAQLVSEQHWSILGLAMSGMTPV